MKFRIFLFIFLFLLPFNLSAQFYTVGDDPASLKWYSIETKHFNLIYPKGLDSLARVYGTDLENYRKAVGRSAGYTPCEYTKVKMPVVLHAWNSQSNGSVAWAPKRMDLFTIPQYNMAEAMPWTKMLAIHESRHVAQMQFGLSHVFRPFRFVFGEMLAGAAAGIYPGMWLLEGDAVTAETALTRSGRGRSADFLNYFMAAFDRGDFRNFYRWDNGSYKHYTPDAYALGYMIISGTRYLYDTHHFTDIYLHHAAKQPYDLLIHTSFARRATGTSFNQLVSDAMNIHHKIWMEEKELRKPFIPSEPASNAKNRRYTQYSGNIAIGPYLWTIKNSMDKSRVLVKIDSSGKEKTVCPFAIQTSKLTGSENSGRLYWSEIMPSARWGQKKNSIIRYIDLNKGIKRNLSHRSRYFHPCLSPDDRYLSVTEYLVKGGSKIVILNSKNGDIVKSYNITDSLQVIESAWIDEKICFTAISDSGYGIYALDNTNKLRNNDSLISCITPPSHIQIRNLRGLGNNLLFTCDRTGVNEMYMLNTDNHIISKHTSTEYGADDFQFMDDFLYYSAYEYDGKLLKRTPKNHLTYSEPCFEMIHSYKIADKLSQQERAISCTVQKNKESNIRDSVTFSSPERYRKFPTMFNIHSWAPVYFNYDNITNFSYDHIYELASLGATALMQNRLGTFCGYFGYSAHKDPDNKSLWRHSGHLKFTYSGLYPVIEASLDFNDRASISENLYCITNGDKYKLYINPESTGKPNIDANLKVYIPFNFSGGGWNRGIIPAISWNITNDLMNYSIPVFEEITDSYNTTTYEYLKDIGTDKTNIIQSLKSSLRMYSMRSKAMSEVFPDLGIGVEIGYTHHIGNRKFLSPMSYIYTYGYLPGITNNQGLNLSVLWKCSVNKTSLLSSLGINNLPRGLANNSVVKNYAAKFRHSARFSANYAIPIHIGDFHISSAFYGKRVHLTPHFDYTILGKKDGLFSVGASVELEFGCFFWIATPISIGVTYSYNGGPSFDNAKIPGIEKGRHFVGPIFNFSLPQ